MVVRLFPTKKPPSFLGIDPFLKCLLLCKIVHLQRILIKLISFDLFWVFLELFSDHSKLFCEIHNCWFVKLIGLAIQFVNLGFEIVRIKIRSPVFVGALFTIIFFIKKFFGVILKVKDINFLKCIRLYFYDSSPREGYPLGSSLLFNDQFWFISPDLVFLLFIRIQQIVFWEKSV